MGRTGQVQEMDVRGRIEASLKDAMRARDAHRLSTLRLITAAIKDRDIAARSDGEQARVDDAEVLALLGRMVRQRQESARAYEEGGRLELVEKERAEIRMIEEFLPRPLSADQVEAAIAAAIGETGATSLRDMGKVMAVLKSRHVGRMDFSAVGPQVKARLG